MLVPVLPQATKLKVKVAEWMAKRRSAVHSRPKVGVKTNDLAIIVPVLQILLMLGTLAGYERFEPEAGCYLGAYLGMNRPNEEVATPIDSFLAKAGKAHATYHRFIPWDAQFPRTWADSVVRYEVALLISYGMPDSLTMATRYNLQDTVFMRFVRDMKQFGGPIFLRLGWEMNGNWYWWGQCARHFVPAFKRAARIVHDSCPNVAMVWCPNYGSGYPWGGVDEGDAYTAYYPADDSFSYVDWVGLDFYHNLFWGNQYTPLDAILGKPEGSQVYFYRHFCNTLGKPMLFGETSTLENTRNNQIGDLQRWWITTLYDSANLSSHWPKLKAITWFHVLKKEAMGGNYDWVDWRITDSSLTLYRAAIRSSYFLSHPDTGRVVGIVEEKERDTAIGLLNVRQLPSGILVKYEVQPHESGQIEVFDISGKRLLIREFRAGAIGRGEIVITSEALGSSSGILLLALTSERRCLTKKISLAR